MKLLHATLRASLALLLVSQLPACGGGGGGIATSFSFTNGILQIYNNVICNNSIVGIGGGILNYWSPVWLSNNTICNNQATAGGNSISMQECDIVMYNNIIGSDVDNEGSDFIIENKEISTLIAYYNLLKDPFLPDDPVTEKGNTYLDAIFDNDSYELADTSPAIGRGVDSLQVDGIWYYAPSKDISGKDRPDAVDSYVDLGAYESGYSRLLYDVADLVNIGLKDHEIRPSFHKDTMEYIIPIADTTRNAPELLVIPADGLAILDIQSAIDLTSQNLVDLTTTIGVTSSDQSTQKSYSVLFDLLSIDASLSSLVVDTGELEPSFDPEVLSYVDTLCKGTTVTPGVTYATSDENASVELKPATDVTSFIKDLRTTKIIVTAELGTPSRTYEVEFFVDPTKTCSTSTISVAESTREVRLYPNPFNTYANLEISRVEKVKSIRLFNIMGQVVRNIDYTKGEAMVIERNGLASGLYFLRIQSDRIVVKKVLIE